MEDLDIDVEEIKGNFKSVLFFKKFEKKFVKDLDLLGPVAVALALGFIMTLVRGPHQQRKFIFGYIYGFLTMGSFLVYSIINLVIKDSYFSLYHTVSTLGYSMMPLFFMGLLGVGVSMR